MAKKTSADVTAFKAWISANGGEVLVTTNSFEVVRFRTSAGVCIIYKNALDRWSSYQGKLCQDAWMAFKENRGLRLNTATSRHQKPSVVIRSLLERDGATCFYCAVHFGDDVFPTVEHLVSATHHGPDHIANKFLACFSCNAEAGHLSAVEKIRMRERKQGLRRLLPAPVPFFLCEAA